MPGTTRIHNIKKYLGLRVKSVSLIVWNSVASISEMELGGESRTILSVSKLIHRMVRLGTTFDLTETAHSIQTSAAATNVVTSQKRMRP